MLYLRQWRKWKGLTLQQLEHETGIDFRSLSKYERGQVDPQTGQITKIATALGVSEGMLFAPAPVEETSHAGCDSLPV